MVIYYESNILTLLYVALFKAPLLISRYMWTCSFDEIRPVPPPESVSFGELAFMDCKCIGVNGLAGIMYFRGFLPMYFAGCFKLQVKMVKIIKLYDKVCYCNIESNIRLFLILPWILRAAKGITTIKQTVFWKWIISSSKFSSYLFIGCSSSTNQNHMKTS